MSSSEVIEILNQDGEVIGTVTREEAEQNNHTTPNVLIFIFNSLGKVWVQLRPMTKNHYPGRWDISACGGVLSGESRQMAAERETFEETGLKLTLRYVETFLNVFPGDDGREQRSRLSHLYIGVSDEIPQPNNEEVDDFKAWGPAALRADALQNPAKYIPSLIIELDKAVEGYQKLFTAPSA